MSLAASASACGKPSQPSQPRDETATAEAACRYEPFEGVCRVTNVRERVSPSGERVIFTATFVADFAGGSHFDQEFKIPENGAREFREYITKPSTMVVCAGEAIASGTCKVRTRGTAKSLMYQSVDDDGAP